MEKKVTRFYQLEHLGCAHCASQIEEAVQALPDIEEATLSFATKQLRVTTTGTAELQTQIQQICDRIEQGVIVEDGEGALDTAESRADAGEDRSKLWQLAAGIVLYGFTMFSGQVPQEYVFPFYGAAYILFGYDIIKGAGENMRRGKFFDEKFLMVIATLGAFAIGEYAEGVGVMLFSRIGEALEDRAVEQSRRQIMAAVDLRPETVQQLDAAGEVQEIAAAAARIGDLLLLRAGDRIPLDGIVDRGESLIDTSALTGEPVPVVCHPGDVLLSGSINTTGVLHLRVTKVLRDSMVSKVLESVERAAAKKPHMDRFITRFSRVYTPIVVVIAAATAILPSLVTGQWYHWIYVALTFLVISCPCALVLSVPLSFFAGIGAASRQGILFKGGLAIEGLNRVKAVVLDKTGTVTKGDFVVQDICPADGISPEQLLGWCASAEQGSLHPIARSVVTAAQERQLRLIRPEAVREEAGKGIVVCIEGKEILCGNQELLVQQGITDCIMPENEYGSALCVACDGVYAGTIFVADTVKDDAVEAVQKIHGLGAATAMLTGDSAGAADYIARLTGIDEVRAKLLPQDKVTCMDDIRRKYGPVLFVGDGINDAPVLAGADVGAAMGSGADAAVEAADIVFLNSQMTAVPQAMLLARTTAQVAWQNIILALAVKIIVMLAGFAGYASLWAAVFADSGVAVVCVLNSVRILYKKI